MYDYFNACIYMYLEFFYNCHNSAKYFRLSSTWNVPLIVNQNGFQQRRKKMLPDLHSGRELKVVIATLNSHEPTITVS